MKIADGELRQILLHDLKLPATTVRELVADSRQSNQSLLRVVRHSRLVSEVQIAKAHAKRLGVPFIDLQAEGISAKTVARIPSQIARKYRLVCFDETATGVKIAMADPRNEAARKAIKDYTGKTVRRYLTTDAGLHQVMRAYGAHSLPHPLTSRDLLITILEQAERSESKEVHFEIADKQLFITRRSGVKMITMSQLPASRFRGILGWCKLQIRSDVVDNQRTHHGSFSLKLNNEIHEVVVSILPTISGEKLSLRLVSGAARVPELADLGYNKEQIKMIGQAIQDGHGLIIIAGGKTNTVPAALARVALDAAAIPSQDVSSIENPIHYKLPGVSQTETTQALPFSDIIDAVVIQNPTTLITSTLGGSADMQKLIDFSLSRHLVVSSMYATSMNSASKHLRSYPIAPALLAASLRLIIVHHTIEQLCVTCRIVFKPVGPLKKVLTEQLQLEDDAKLYRKGEGCFNCDDGYNRRVTVAEILKMTPMLQQEFANHADQATLAKLIRDHSDLKQSITKLVNDGSISVDQALKLVG